VDALKRTGPAVVGTRIDVAHSRACGCSIGPIT